MRSLLIVTLLCASLSIACVSAKDCDAYYYRMWNGWRLPKFSENEFLGRLGKNFLNLTVNFAHEAPSGLSSYIVVTLRGLAPELMLPDEFALIVYDSKEIYDAKKSTPGGKAYSAAHGDLFGSPSRSQVPDTSGSARFSLSDPKAFDVCNSRMNWQLHYKSAYLRVYAAHPNVSSTGYMVSAAQAAYGRLRNECNRGSSLQSALAMLLPELFYLDLTMFADEDALNDALSSKNSILYQSNEILKAASVGERPLLATRISLWENNTYHWGAAVNVPL